MIPQKQVLIGFFVAVLFTLPYYKCFAFWPFFLDSLKLKNQNVPILDRRQSYSLKKRCQQQSGQRFNLILSASGEENGYNYEKSYENIQEKHIPLPVHPNKAMTRTIPFPGYCVDELSHTRQKLFGSGQHTDDLKMMVFPSWRQHPLHFDAVIAASKAVGMDAQVSLIPDYLWARMFRMMETNRLRPHMEALPVSCIVRALSPVLGYLDTVLERHYASNPSSKLLLVGSDDSSWVLQAFLNTRTEAWQSKHQVQGLVTLGGNHLSDAGRLTSEYLVDVPLDIPRLAFRGQEPEYNAAIEELVLNLTEEEEDPANIYCVSIADSESCIISGVDSRSYTINEGLQKPEAVSLWLSKVCNVLVGQDEQHL